MSFFGKKGAPEKTDEPHITHTEAEPAPAPGARPGYGIESAIRLMRSLPTDQNVDLVVRVIKNTLESMNVRLADILNDASQKQQALGGRIKDLKGEIAELEKQIGTRRSEIEQLEQDLAETTTVKDRLALAEASSKGPAPASKALPSTDQHAVPGKAP
jgi:hypothetical protein